MKLKLALNDFELSNKDFSQLSNKNRTFFSLSFCLDTKERKNQVADYSSIHSTLEIRPFQRSLRAALRFPYLNSLHFIRIIGDRRKKTNATFEFFCYFFCGPSRASVTSKKSRVSSSEANNKIKFNFNRIVVYSKNNP